MLTLEQWFDESPLRRCNISAPAIQMRVELTDEHGNSVVGKARGLSDAIDKALREWERRTIEARAQTDVDDAEFMAEQARRFG